jgi:hypothetical protein
MNLWFASIEDKELRQLVSENTIVTGGCIASMLLKEDVRDYDVYFRTKEVAFKVAKYYVERFKVKDKSGYARDIKVNESEDRIRVVVKSAGVVEDQENIQDPGSIEDTYESTETQALEQKEDGYRPIFISTNAITLSNKVQIILRFFGEPEEIHKNYDFVHCTNYWKSWNLELEINQKALESLLTKELRYVGSKYPICSLFRLRKFLGRGWTINAGQILKIAWQVSELDLTDVKVLEDQLTGVDVAYFNSVVYQLKQNDPEKVNSAYLVEILERMF